MTFFGRFYLDKEKDMLVELYREADEISYVLRTPHHGTGNLIRNLAALCHLPLSYDEQGLMVIRGKLLCYVNADNQLLYVLRLLDTKVANVFPDGRIERKATISAIAKTLMSQTKDYRLDFKQTVVKTYIFNECKFHTDLHTHMNANLDADILIALGITHQIEYPLYYIRKLELRLTPAQQALLDARREEAARELADSELTGKYRERRIDDNTVINFASFMLESPETAAYNIPKIRASLAVLKDGQAVFTNLEKVYLYRYVFTKGRPSQQRVPLDGLDRLPDPDIQAAVYRMLADRVNPAYAHNSLFQDKLLWIARGYARYGIRYAEISDTTLVKREEAARMLREVHEVMPHVTEETGVTLRFLAAMRRIPLTIVKDRIMSGDYLKENVPVLRAVAMDPYVAGADIVGEEINDIRDLEPLLREMVRLSGEVPGFTLRIHAGENDALRDNVANALRCIHAALTPGQERPPIRIGHGIYTANLNTAKGRRLIEEMKKAGVVLEFQITSNVRLNNLNSLKDFPLKRYLNAGIRCVQGTDGAALYGTDSIDEQLSLEKMLGLTPEEMKRMRRTEEEVTQNADAAAAQKTEVFEALAGGRDVEAFYRERIRAQATEAQRMNRVDHRVGAEETLGDRVAAMPADRLPVVLIGGSFNNDRHVTRLKEEHCRLLDGILEQADPKKVFFVIGHCLNGYEKYLLEKNAGRFAVYAMVPTVLTRQQAKKLRAAGVPIRISIEPSGMGSYKSFAYEIFMRRPSVLLALDGNSSGANMIQEAKNGRRCKIFVNRNAQVLRAKALSLKGYVQLIGGGDEGEELAAVMKAITEEKEN